MSELDVMSTRGHLRPGGHSRAPLFVILGMGIVAMFLLANSYSLSGQKYQLEQDLFLTKRKYEDVVQKKQELGRQNEEMKALCETKAADFENKLGNSKKELSAASEKLDGLKAQFDELKSELSKAQRENEQLKGQLSSAEKEKTELTKNLNQVQAKLDGDGKNSEQMGQEIQGLKDQLLSCQQQLVHLKKVMTKGIGQSGLSHISGSEPGKGVVPGSNEVNPDREATSLANASANALDSSSTLHSTPTGLLSSDENHDSALPVPRAGGSLNNFQGLANFVSNPAQTQKQKSGENSLDGVVFPPKSGGRPPSGEKSPQDIAQSNQGNEEFVGQRRFVEGDRDDDRAGKEGPIPVGDRSPADDGGRGPPMKGEPHEDSRQRYRAGNGDEDREANGAERENQQVVVPPPANRKEQDRSMDTYRGREESPGRQKSGENENPNGGDDIKVAPGPGIHKADIDSLLGRTEREPVGALRVPMEQGGGESDKALKPPRDLNE